LIGADSIHCIRSLDLLALEGHFKLDLVGPLAVEHRPAEFPLRRVELAGAAPLHKVGDVLLAGFPRVGDRLRTEHPALGEDLRTLSRWMLQLQPDIYSACGRKIGMRVPTLFDRNPLVIVSVDIGARRRPYPDCNAKKYVSGAAVVFGENENCRFRCFDKAVI